MKSIKFGIVNNTDTTDIEDHCLGLNVMCFEFKDLQINRGLHIQIKHNKDKATFNAANKIAKVICAAPEMLEALISTLAALQADEDKLPLKSLAQIQIIMAAVSKAKG